MVLPRVAQPRTRLSTLPNGLRVATERSVAECETVTVGVWIDAGSRYEAESNNGVAHFLEHMAFKGTRGRAQKELEVMIEDMGAHLNAYTSREQTVYYAKLFKRDARRGMEVLADILQNSVLDRGAIERERDVIMREMEEVNKQHEELLLDLLHEAAFAGGGLGRTILGPEANIRSISRQDLLDYVETHYTAPRMLVAAAGAVDHDEITALAEEYFGQQPASSTTNFAVDFDPAVFAAGEVRHPDAANEPRAHVALAFDGAHWTSPYSLPLMVLQTMLGQWDRLNPASGGLDSPYALARAMAALTSGGSNGSAQSSGIPDDSLAGGCHSYMTFNTCYKDAGLFGVYLVASPDGVADATQTVLRYLASLSTPGAFDDHDVDRAKAQLKANIVAQLDALAHVCEEIGRQYLTYGRRMPVVEVLARIDAIQPRDVRATAKRFLADKPHALAAYGAIDHLPAYADLHISNYVP